ncbi:MAG TPA: hypothetical protein VF824_03735 [Thermoanaerobaculia bacterium]
MLLFAFVPVLVAEIILSWRWNARYLTFGIPIFIRRVRVAVRIEELDVDEVARRTENSAASGALRFRRLAGDAIAFREPFASGAMLRYAPIMRGVIRPRTSEPAVEVVGLLNWTVVAVIAAFALAFGEDALGAAPYIGGALAIVYLIQSVRYYRVGTAIARVAGGEPASAPQRAT